MTTTTLHLTTSDLCLLLCAIAAAQTEAMDDELIAESDAERRAAQNTLEMLSAMYYRLHVAEEALRQKIGPAEDPAFATWQERLDAAPDMDYPPGKVRPPRAWPAPPGQAQGDAK
jgi:hypothetical protein